MAAPGLVPLVTGLNTGRASQGDQVLLDGVERLHALLGPGHDHHPFQCGDAGQGKTAAPGLG